MNKKFKILILFLILIFSINYVNAVDTVVLNENNYNTYFTDDGEMKNIGENTNLDLQGKFNNKTFNIDRKVNITSTDPNIYLKDCSIILNDKANGSIISNLIMYDTRHFGESITLNSSSNNHIYNNHITCITKGCPLVLLPGSNNNIIEYNNLNTTNDSWDGFHQTLVVFASHYNIIRNNLIYTGDDNGIYLSTFGRSEGVKSNYNKIINNTIIRQGDIVSAWNYGIQSMGDNNLIANNTIYDSYRGISTTNGNNNTIINNTIINAVGDNGIFGSINCEIINNTILECNANIAIYIDENSTVSGNIIETNTGKTMSIGGSNVLIKNNTIKSTGIGIYGLGNIKNIIIDNNYIKSNNFAIQFKKQSNAKKPSNLTIKNNIIESTGSTVVDLKETNNTIIYENNTYIGNDKVILPEEEVIDNDTSNKFDGSTYIVNPENFEEYFDSSGITRNNVLKNGDTIIFKGEFNNKFLTINTRIYIKGNEAIFKNSTFRILKRGCIIENISIINNNPNNNNQWGIYALDVNDVVIRKNNINITDNKTAYGVYVSGCSYVEILDNTIITKGNDLTYPILIYETSKCSIYNNNIIAIGTSTLYNFTSETEISEGHIVPEIYKTYGILLIFTKNSDIENNNVYVTSSISKPLEHNNDCTNSLVGIDIYFDSHSNNVIKNNITVIGYDPYIYGTGVLGSQTGTTTTNARNNEFSNNQINLNGTFFVSGIITGSNSINSKIRDNTLNLNSIMTSYGLTFEESQRNRAERNIINANSTVIYLVELYQSSNNRVLNNILNGDGGYAYGVVGYQSSNNEINSNYINASGTGEGTVETVSHSDVIKAGTSGIKFIKGSNENNIKYNNVTTTGEYSVEILESINNIIIGNRVKSLNLVGESSISAIDNNISNNTEFIFDDGSVKLNIDDTVFIYGENNIFKGVLTDRDNKPIIGAHVLLKLTRLSSGASKTYDTVTDYNGEFNLAINLAPGIYSLDGIFNSISINDKTYLDSNKTVNINIVKELSNKTNTILTIDKFDENYNANKNLTGYLKDINGETIIGQHINLKLTRLSSGASKTYDTVSDYAGTFRLAINLAPGEYRVDCTYQGTSTYEPSSGYNTITIH